jgi:hypothetical protein
VGVRRKGAVAHQGVQPRGTRALLGGGHHARTRLSRLRELAAEALGTRPPDLRQLHRIKPANIVLAVGTLAAAGGLLAGVGSAGQVWETLTASEWQWLLTASLGAFGETVPFGPILAVSIATQLVSQLAPSRAEERRYRLSGCQGPRWR